MVRWNDPRDLLKNGMGGGTSQTASAAQGKKPAAGKSDVLKNLIPGQLAKKTTSSANAKLRAVVKGLKK